MAQDAVRRKSPSLDQLLMTGLMKALLVVLGAVLAQILGDTLVYWVPTGWKTAFDDSFDLLVVAALVYLYLVIRRHVNQLRRAHEELRASEQLRDDLTAMLVHDLKSPVIAARGAIEMVTTGPGASALRPRDLRLLTMAASAQDRLGTMIEDILTIHSAEAGCLQLQQSETDLGEVVASCVADCRIEADERKVAIAAEAVDSRTIADAAKIRRVVENLLSNALKHTPAGGQVTAGARTDAEGGTLLFVSDTGPGIAPEHREHVFEKFAQLEAGKSVRSSFGLGLAYCRHVVAAHGGRIWVEEADGGGCVFKVALPPSEGAEHDLDISHD